MLPSVNFCLPPPFSTLNSNKSQCANDPLVETQNHLAVPFDIPNVVADLQFVVEDRRIILVDVHVVASIRGFQVGREYTVKSRVLHHLQVEVEVK